MSATLDEKLTPKNLLGVEQDPSKPHGRYVVFRCGTCANVHLGVVAVPAAFNPIDQTVAAQLSMSGDEARQVAAELLAAAEEH